MTLAQHPINIYFYSIAIYLWLWSWRLDDPEISVETAETPAQVKTVTADILNEFFDALAEVDGLGAVSLRLRKTVLDDGLFAEPAIRAAIFPSSQ